MDLYKFQSPERDNGPPLLSSCRRQCKVDNLLLNESYRNYLIYILVILSISQLIFFVSSEEHLGSKDLVPSLRSRSRAVNPFISVYVIFGLYKS